MTAGRPVRAKASPWPFVGHGRDGSGVLPVRRLRAGRALVGADVLLFVWLVLFVTACRWWTPHPGRLPLLAVAAVVFWFLAVSAGGAWLGWTA